jgi:hypothetical protein
MGIPTLSIRPDRATSEILALFAQKDEKRWSRISIVHVYLTISIEIIRYARGYNSIYNCLLLCRQFPNAFCDEGICSILSLVNI